MEQPDATEPSRISVPPNHIQRASTDSLQRAARHYKRTLATLHASSFEQLPEATLCKLTAHLAEGLDAVVQELRRRGLDGSTSRVPTVLPRRSRNGEGGSRRRVGGGYASAEQRAWKKEPKSR